MYKNGSFTQDLQKSQVFLEKLMDAKLMDEKLMDVSQVAQVLYLKALELGPI